MWEATNFVGKPTIHLISLMYLDPQYTWTQNAIGYVQCELICMVDMDLDKIYD